MDRLQGVSVLVTGGAGFIGSRVVKHLVEAGASVRVLDNLSTGRAENLRPFGRCVDLIEGDIRNAAACRSACAGVQYVFHLAAYVSVTGSIIDPVSSDAVNIGGTLNVLNAAREMGVRRLVFSSSAAVYGNTEVVPTPECTVPEPMSPYGVEKLYGEHMCRIYSALHGLQTVSLRYFNVYGPGQDPDSEYAAVIPKFLQRLQRSCPPVIFGDGLQTRDFLHVDDVARANLLAAVSQAGSGSVFNIALGGSTSLVQLAQMLSEIVGSAHEVEFAPARPGDIRHSRADVSAARDVLGFSGQVSLETGLRETAVWFRNLRQP